MTTGPGAPISAEAVPPVGPGQPARPARRFSGLALAGWIAFGLLAALSVLGMLTIGIFVLPFALALLGVLLVKQRPHALAGAPIGAGLMLLWVAWNLRWVSPASCSGTVSSGPGDGARTVSDACGPTLEIPWFWLLLALAALAVGVAFLTRDLRRWRSDRAG